MSESETVIIVGVGPGLGLALVETFAGAGMKVAMAARKTAHLDALLPDDRGGRIRTYPCDTTDPAAVEGLFEQATAELGAPDVAVYNAGAFRPGGILEIAPDDFESCWKVGCYGGFLVGQAAAKARELGPQGLHVAHVVIDGIIDAERSRGLKESDAPDARLAPEAIAANYLMLHRQPRSAWTQELDLRPWVEKF
jgi:NAD(P)-dependent dehydrogenase (short-subunit alcohol dehydrogenase family)